MSKKRKFKQEFTEPIFCPIPLRANVYVEGVGYDKRHRPIVNIIGISHEEIWSEEQNNWLFPDGSYTELIDKIPGIILGHGIHLPIYWSFRKFRGMHPSGLYEWNPGLYVYKYQVYKYVGCKVGLFTGWDSV